MKQFRCGHWTFRLYRSVFDWTFGWFPNKHKGWLLCAGPIDIKAES